MRARSAHRRCDIIPTEHCKRGHFSLILSLCRAEVRRVRDLPTAGVNSGFSVILEETDTEKERKDTYADKRS